MTNNTNNGSKKTTQQLSIPALRERLRRQATDLATQLSRSVGRAASADLLPCLEYRTEVCRERELAEELLYVQSCRASLEKAIGGGMARLVWHWRSGAVTTVVFRRQNNQMRMTTRTGGSGAA